MLALTITHAFGPYLPGETVTDADEIERIASGENASRTVRVDLPDPEPETSKSDEPEAAPASAGDDKAEPKSADDNPASDRKPEPTSKPDHKPVRLRG